MNLQRLNASLEEETSNKTKTENASAKDYTYNTKKWRVVAAANNAKYL